MKMNIEKLMLLPRFDIVFDLKFKQLLCSLTIYYLIWFLLTLLMFSNKQYSIKGFVNLWTEMPRFTKTGTSFFLNIFLSHNCTNICCIKYLFNIPIDIFIRMSMEPATSIKWQTITINPVRNILCNNIDFSLLWQEKKLL